MGNAGGGGAGCPHPSSGQPPCPEPPRKNPWGGRTAEFVADGLGVLHRSSSGYSLLREIPQDEHPIEDLVRLAQLLSGQRPDYTERGQPLPSEPLRETWQKLRLKYPAEFGVSREEILAWHRQQAETCERATNWTAAAFRWNQLTQLDPADPTFRNRHAAAQKALESRRSSPAP